MTHACSNSEAKRVMLPSIDSPLSINLIFQDALVVKASYPRTNIHMAKLFFLSFLSMRNIKIISGGHRQHQVLSPPKIITILIIIKFQVPWIDKIGPQMTNKRSTQIGKICGFGSWFRSNLFGLLLDPIHSPEQNSDLDLGLGVSKRREPKYLMPILCILSI